MRESGCRIRSFNIKADAVPDHMRTRPYVVRLMYRGGMKTARFDCVRGFYDWGTGKPTSYRYVRQGTSGH